ncbi:hypothetical protein [Methylorubrum extorquens]
MAAPKLACRARKLRHGLLDLAQGFLDVVPVKGHIYAIDSSTDDNGALLCGRSHEKPHVICSNTHEAVTGFTNYYPNIPTGAIPTFVISGHGSPGSITTGLGQRGITSFDDLHRFISTSNRDYWVSEIKRLKKRVPQSGEATPIVVLWACHPGANIDGAVLTYLIAQEAKCICLAPTGYTYCSSDGNWSEAGSEWQVANWNMQRPPEPKPPPSAIKGKDYVYFMNSAGKWMGFEQEKIKNVSMYLEYEENTVVYQGPKLELLLKSIAFSDPERIPGVPNALITSRLTVDYRFHQQDLRKYFVVYNNLLCVDLDYPSVAYRIDKDSLPNLPIYGTSIF